MESQSQASERDGAEGNKTIVVFGVNPKIMHILVSLLSNDGNLEVIITDDDYPIIVNPKDPSWRPNPKYILCHAYQPDRIESFLASLHGSFRFVVAFDYGSLFRESFGFMLHYLENTIQMMGARARQTNRRRKKTLQQTDMTSIIKATRYQYLPAFRGTQKKNYGNNAIPNNHKL
ncbi:uncharacterized protein LOC116339219 isoform X2 [Contarinia nasturtii]|uniref:uncharacterized protein LOC116339219 isoform X2 n=1 Tax=Contarinia nasturtii TaxID=265458 RepID=UPI0012D49D80|nr:uncharacterized protein LOC116339219 isoform X2 [Contarinia nasturtii]